MKTTIYQLGASYIFVTMPQEMLRPKNLSKFEVAEASDIDKRKIFYTLEFTDDILKCEEECRKHQVGQREVIRDSLRIFYVDGGECRMIGFSGGERYYAISCPEEENRFRVFVDRQIGNMLVYDTLFVALFSLERQMIENGDMIFHSAYIYHDGSAILFSAPSETGKSTQASLWEKYRGASTVNGDRSLLMRCEQGWYAGGWPVCGSSGICKNESYPIRAIVMLKQAKENKAYPLKGIQAVREIMEQITINTWDSQFQMKVLDNLELLLQEVPIYRLECDISEGAVECLSELL